MSSSDVVSIYLAYMYSLRHVWVRALGRESHSRCPRPLQRATLWLPSEGAQGAGAGRPLRQEGGVAAHGESGPAGARPAHRDWRLSQRGCKVVVENDCKVEEAAWRAWERRSAAAGVRAPRRARRRKGQSCRRRRSVRPLLGLLAWIGSGTGWCRARAGPCAGRAERGRRTSPRSGSRGRGGGRGQLAVGRGGRESTGAW